MKLLTHNFLSSRFLKNVATGYPLLLRVNEKELREVEFDQDFVQNIMPKVDYNCLVSTLMAIGEQGALPNELPENWRENEELLKELHRVLVKIEVIVGELECPESGRVFPIKDGIPNMLCQEDEC
ncbi:unnamed protein product, partial [Mesorhabditis belari]|uniref:Multifunctional methyltransferase subunit TRM112-like protein n=1 Tax=Mesorhabditis belari TaxID=2138241 RepID=A0AAF3FCI4_9BILA